MPRPSEPRRRSGRPSEEGQRAEALSATLAFELRVDYAFGQARGVVRTREEAEALTTKRSKGTKPERP